MPIWGGAYHASLWTGSAASWLDLNPAGSRWSVATGAYDGQQVGYVIIADSLFAGMWSSSAASWVNLNPGGATASYAFGVYDGQQVGRANVGGLTRASLWTGSAASWVDLHPAGATSSEANGVYGGQQVGDAAIGGSYHASLWSGSAASWVDLHTLLPSQFSGSVANGIWNDGVFTYVVGNGYNATTGHYEALMWVVPEPASRLVLAAGLAAFALLRRRRK